MRRVQKRLGSARRIVAFLVKKGAALISESFQRATLLFCPGEDFRRPPEGPVDEEQEGQDREQEGARQGEGHPEVRAGLAQRRRNGQKGAGHQGLLCGRRQERPGQGAVRQGKGDLRSLRESGAELAFVVIHGAGHPPKDSS